MANAEINYGKIAKHFSIFVLPVILLWWLSPLTIINAGEVGIVLNWGAYTGTQYEAGMHLRIPFMQRIERMNVRTTKDEIDASAASKDLQDVQARVALTRHIDPNRVGDLFKQVGANNAITDTLISPAIQESVKAATSQFTAEELVTKRDQVKEKIKIALKERLGTNFIVVEDISIVNFEFSASFNQAIEAKVTAEQNALTSKNLLEQKKYEAEQTIVSAKAEAESIRIKTQAVNSQGGKDYVQLQAITKWDGKLPTQMIPNAATPFIDITPSK